jgi:cytochrome c553
MPGICTNASLSASDIADLGAYMETLSPGDGGGDAVEGASLYTSNNCANCHGASGEGGIGGAVAGLGATELQSSCDGSGTMPTLCTPLTASDIADLGAYMETL